MSTSDHAAGEPLDQARASASTYNLDSADLAASTQPGGEDRAHLNAGRLSLAARWRHVLGEDRAEEGQPQPPTAPLSLRGDEMWEAHEMSDIWQQAQHDEVLLAMLREDQDEGVGSELLDPREVQRARARFQDRMQAAPRQESRPQPAILTVGEVVEELEREAGREAAGRSAGAGAWRSIFGPLRASREALPAHITSNAMSAFWQKMGLSVPREMALSFNQAARLLLMGRADSGARLSLARESRPSGISQAVAQLALESSTDVPDLQPAEPAVEAEAASDQKEAGEEASGD